MALTKLQFRPGIVRDQTAYTNEGGWRDSNLVRFRLGFPESVGGWERYSFRTFQGTCRSLHNWVALDGDNLLGMGTHKKFYIEEGGDYFDITPIRSVVTLSNPFAATTASTTLVVTDVNHGAVEGDYVTFSGATSLGGDITASILNREYEITSIISNDAYQITLPIPATSSDTGQGGSSVTASYQINTGLDSQAGGNGWGAGQWPITQVSSLSNPFATTNGSTTVTVTHTSHGLSTNDYVFFSGATSVGGIDAIYFTYTKQITVVNLNSYTIEMPFAATSTATGGGAVTEYAQFGSRGWGQASEENAANILRLWSQDNFGEDLIFGVRNGGIYYWQKSLGLTSRGVTIASLSSDPTCPTLASQIMISDRDRHVIAFGADNGDGILDPMRVRWSSQEDYTVWTATPENTAGDIRLGFGSYIICAVETKRATMIFTDSAVYSMQFVGPPYTFSVDQVGSNITVMGYNAAVAVDDSVFWMGRDGFFLFSGQVISMPCPIEEYIFEHLNMDQSDKVYAGVNTAFNEVTWFYPSLNSSECDSYVTYNYVEQVWTYGSLARTAWIDRGIRPYPIAPNPADHRLYNHELGYNDGSSVPPLPINSYIESSPVDIAEGDQFMLISRIIPDLSIRTFQTNPTSPTVNFTLKTQNFPGQNYSETQVSPVTKTASVPIGQYTKECFVRLRGRSVVMRVEADQVDMGWRLGSPRLDLRTDGRR